MKMRIFALLAMVGLFAGLAVSASADPGEKNCDRSKAYGCDDHPGEHDDDDGEEPEAPSCADIPAIEPSLDAGVQALCAAVTDALAGGGGGGEPSCDDLAAVDPGLADACNSVVNPEPGPEPEPGGEPSCDDLAAVAQELADACNSVVNPEPGPSPEPGAPSCADIPAIEPSVDAGLQAACAAVTDALGGGGEAPTCADIPSIDPATVDGPIQEACAALAG
jgi:hypothetical protein